MDDTTYAEAMQDHSTAPLLCPDVYLQKNHVFCDWATTITGWDVNSGKWQVVAVTCKRWGCPYCAVRKIRRLAWMSRNAQPNRLLTLTHSAKEWPDGETCWKASSKAFPELIRFIRKDRGSCEYLRVLELQENGMPHFHCMLRSPFLPQQEVHREWQRLTGKAGVNLKKIDDSFRTFRYLVKYLTKLHKIPWTDRHVSYSKGFFRPEDLEQVEYAKLDHTEKHEQHPWQFLAERYSGSEVRVLSHNVWELDGEIAEPMGRVNPADLGLPTRTAEKTTLPLKQRMVPGIEDATDRDENDGLRTDGTRKRTTHRRKPKTTIDLPQKQEEPVPYETPF